MPLLTAQQKARLVSSYQALQTTIDELQPLIDDAMANDQGRKARLLKWVQGWHQGTVRHFIALKAAFDSYDGEP